MSLTPMPLPDSAVTGAPDAKDRLYIAVRDGQPVSAAQLDAVIAGRLDNEDVRDVLLVANWLSAEVASAGRESWWANVTDNAPLRGLHLVCDRHRTGWGGASEYPLTTWVQDRLARQWPWVFERTLDELVIPALSGGPLHAGSAAAQARAEARLRVSALVAARVPPELRDGGSSPPLLALAGDLADELRSRRSRRAVRLSAQDYYALLVAWRSWCPQDATATRPAQALLAAKLADDPDPLGSMCAALPSGRRRVQFTETGAQTFTVSLVEYGQAEPVSQESFGTAEESFSRSVRWTDQLREHCREHNRQLAETRRAELAARVQRFMAAVADDGREPASALAAARVAAAAPAMDATSAVRMLRARV